MSLSANTAWEVRTGGSANNGGGFNVGNSNFASDLTASSATGTGPVVSSASYTFVSGDVGAILFIRSGTNWTPGFYAITSVSAGAATLTASIGSVSLYGGATLLNTVAGCATTASPTAGTWGIDYSQQTSAQFAYTDLVIGTTTTNLTSSGHPFGQNCVGNLLQVTGGTGFTAGTYEVVSVSGTTATMDRSVGTASSASGTGNLGGAVTLTQAATTCVRSNKVFVKAGSGYTVTSSVTFANGGTPAPTSPPNRVTGYSSYRGDGGRATITLSGSSITGLYVTAAGYVIENFYVNCASQTSSIGINLAGNYSVARNCKVANSSSRGILNNGGYSIVIGCEVTACTAGFGVYMSAGNGLIGCWIHDNSATGVICSNSFGVVVGNLITKNTGGGVSCFTSCIVNGNTIDGNTGNGVNAYSGVPSTQSIRNNLITNNSGYGLAGNAVGGAADPTFDGNAYYNNTSGTREYADDRGSTNAINGVASYVDSSDLILTANPYVNASISDYRLNNAVGGGALCRGHGVPGTFPGNTYTTNYPDMGAADHYVAQLTYRGRRGT